MVTVGLIRQGWFRAPWYHIGTPTQTNPFQGPWNCSKLIPTHLQCPSIQTSLVRRQFLLVRLLSAELLGVPGDGAACGRPVTADELTGAAARLAVGQQDNILTSASIKARRTSINHTTNAVLGYKESFTQDRYFKDSSSVNHVLIWNPSEWNWKCIKLNCIVTMFSLWL